MAVAAAGGGGGRAAGGGGRGRAARTAAGGALAAAGEDGEGARLTPAAIAGAGDVALHEPHVLRLAPPSSRGGDPARGRR